MTAHRDERIRTFTERGFWTGETLDDLLGAALRAHPERLALVDQPNRDALFGGTPQRLSYGELERHVGAWTEVLEQHGIGAGDVLVAQLPNVTEFVLVYLAMARIGAIISPLPVQYGAHELRMVSRELPAKAYLGITQVGGQAYGNHAMGADIAFPKRLFLGSEPPQGGQSLDSDLAAALTESRSGNGSKGSAKDAANDVFTVCWTSGTTGTPKGVPRTQNQWAAISWATFDAAELRDGDVLLNPFPFVNMASIGGFLFNWLRCSGTLVLHHPLDLPVFLQQIAAEGSSFTIAPPALLNMLLKQESLLAQVDLSRLRAIGSGSAPLSPWMVRGFAEQHGIDIINLFGSNEGISLAAGPREIPDPEQRATLFPRFGARDLEWSNRVAAMIETRLVDTETGAEITAVDSPGELQVRGATLFDGYLGDTADNDAAFAENGWFRTGDLFEITGSGDPPEYYRFVGRCKDIIVRGGYNISPDELDTLLASHPRLTEAACVGYPDDVLGEKVCVFVVPKPDAEVTLADITAFLEEQGIARFKLPERLEVIDKLPRNALAKVVRGELRQRLD